VSDEQSEASVSQQQWSVLARAILLVLGAGAFLILMSSAASALDIIDDTGLVGGTTDAVGETAGALGEAATGAVGDTTEAATGAIGDTTEAISETAAGAVDGTLGTVGETSDAASGTVDALVGTAGDTLDAGTTLLRQVTDDTLTAVSGTVDTTTSALEDLVSGVSGVIDGSLVPIPGPAPPDSGSDPTDPARSGPSPPSSQGGRFGLPEVGSGVTDLFDLHLAPPDGVRSDPGGATPGVPPSGRAPTPLDVAAAALRGLQEAGGSSLVLWGLLLALLGLLPVMDDRWLRFVRPVPPRAPFVASSDPPG